MNLSSGRPVGRPADHTITQKLMYYFAIQMDSVIFADILTSTWDTKFVCVNDAYLPYTDIFFSALKTGKIQVQTYNGNGTHTLRNSVISCVYIPETMIMFWTRYLNTLEKKLCVMRAWVTAVTSKRKAKYVCHIFPIHYVYLSLA